MFISNSAEDTIKFGREFGESLKQGDVVALIGELGAGKTTLVKGIVQGLGVKDGDEVLSPSFVLVREYAGRLPIYHFDLYRLESIEDMEGIGYEEYIYGQGVTLIEWADRIPEILPERYVEVRMEVLGKNKRKIYETTRD